MPRIPIVDNQIKTNEVNYKPVQVATIDQSAMGKDIAQANQGTFNLLQKGVEIGNDYALNEMKLQSETRIADKEFQARQKLNDILNSQEKDEDGKVKGVLNRELENAQGATAEYNKRAARVLEESLYDLNPYEQERIKNSLRNYNETLLNKVSGHEANQKDKHENILFETNQKSMIDSAATYSDDKLLSEDLGKAMQAQTEFMMSKGHSNETIALKNKELADQMIKSNIMAKLEQDPNGALITLEKNKDQLSGEFYGKAKQMVEGKRFDDLRLNLWNNQFSKMKMGDGNVDLARVEKAINASQFTNEQKTKLYDFAQAKSGELRQQKTQAEAARNDSFHNAFAVAMKQGQNLEQTLKLSTKFGGDAFEIMKREEFIKEAFKKPRETNTEIYLSTWEKVQSGDMTREDLHKVWKDGFINNNDYESLSKDLYHKQTTGEGDKNFERIKLLAQDEIGDKKEQAKFLYEIKQATKNMRPEERLAYAKDSLKEVVTKKGWIFDTKEAKYKVDLQKRDANSEAWGMLYNDSGKEAVDAILKTKQFQGVKTVGIEDVSDFANKLGGYDKLKKGTIENEAIMWLSKNKRQVTPDTVKQYIILKKNGKING